ncbi:MAG: hypothetical protein M1497_07780 [Nitrospirae bacterium]|nr:hypothetical protein [Nitrospirota bacterium]
MLLLLSYAFVRYCRTEQRQGSGKAQGGYAKIFCESGETLRLFNKRIKLGFLNSLLRTRTEKDLSVESQLSGKIDVIVERVETILEMRPRNFTIALHVLPDADKVKELYRKKYFRNVDFVAFYAPSEKAVYIAADEAKAVILAHELAHAVIDQYFGVAAPVKIHEILAQYVEENFEE